MEGSLPQTKEGLARGKSLMKALFKFNDGNTGLIIRFCPSAGKDFKVARPCFVLYRL